jgi:hypothetical protein
MASLRDYGPAAPHGPNMTGEHVATRDVHEMTTIEKGVFDFLIRPDDSYDPDGKYWGDMGILERVRFVWGVDKPELKKEKDDFVATFKNASRNWNGVLAPIGWFLGVWTLWAYYFYNCVIPGMGLLLEGYVDWTLFFAAISTDYLSAMSSSPLETSSRSCNPHSKRAGAPIKSAAKPG